MPSIVIAAHNEGSVIARCLTSLTSGETHAAGTDTGLDITVVANGCADDTADIARGIAGVRVLELSTAGKAAALNAGDAVAEGFPRVYLDADITLTGQDVRRLCEAVDAPVHGAAPRRALELAGRPLLVRAYFAINSRLPVFRHALFGRGAIVVSEAGRARFGLFPDAVADDLFLDAQFSSVEKVEVEAVVSRVATPMTTASLYRRLVRVRAGNAAIRGALAVGAHGTTVTQRDTWAWLRVALREPRLLPAAIVYAALTGAAAFAGRRARGREVAWGQDRSTRMSVPPRAEGG